MNTIKGGCILKKKYNLLFILFISSLLFACNTEDVKSVDEREGVYVTFRGRIAEMITDDRAIVWEEGRDTDRILIDLSVNNAVTFQVGDEVEVGFDGVIKESDPAKITTLSVELVE